LFADLIAALRRDPRFAGIQPSELELLLVDHARAFERELSDLLRGRVHLDDVDFVDGGDQ
jgi:hypothetical protein